MATVASYRCCALDPGNNQTGHRRAQTKFVAEGRFELVVLLASFGEVARAQMGLDQNGACGLTQWFLEYNAHDQVNGLRIEASLAQSGRGVLEGVQT